MRTAKFYNLADLATYTAALIREGIVFEVRPLFDAGEGYVVHFTGGY